MSIESEGRSVERFEFLAWSIVGRRVSVRTQQGVELSHCDGRCICLPEQRVSLDQDLWRDVVAQALLLGCGALRADLLRRLVGRPDVARRYAYLEVRRGALLVDNCLPISFVKHAALLPSAIWPATYSPEESLKAAERSRVSGDHVPSFIGTVKPLLALRNGGGDAGNTQAVSDAQRAGRFALADELQEFGDEDATESSSLLSRLGGRLSNGNPMSQALSQLFAQGRSRGQSEISAGAGDGAGEIPVGRIERAWRRGIHSLRAQLPTLFAGLFDDEHSQSANRFPEWDCQQRRYRPAWVRVDEVDPWSEGGASELPNVLVDPGRALRRDLSRLGQEHQMHRRQREGAEFDIGALIDYATELHCGQSPAHQDIYRASRRTQRDLGVLIAVDISGSSGESAAAGELVFHQQLRAAWQLAASFDGLGDRVAFYGFHSWGRESVDMVRLKGHEELWSSRVAQRCQLLQPAGFSRLGAVVRYADQALREKMRLPNRLLILVSDGFSYDQDYEERYAREDTRMAFREARMAGTACVCLSIGGSTSADQLAEVFGAANLLMVDDSVQWQAKIGVVCQRALQSVRMGKGLRNAPRR